MRVGFGDSEPPPSPTSMAGQVVGARVHVEVTVPRTQVKGRMRVLSRSETRAVRFEARAKLQELGIVGDVDGIREWNEEIATRTLAVAVRALKGDEVLASLEAWEECDDDQINALWSRYKDLCNELDPLADTKLSEADAQQIAAAAKKKDSILLTSYGSLKLAAYAISMAELPST